MHDLYILMSVSGSMVFLLCMAINKIYRNCFNEKWKRTLLLFPIPFFLLPVPYFKHHLIDFLWKIAGITQKMPIEGTTVMDKTYVIARSNSGEVFVSFAVKIMFALSCFLAIVAAAVILFQMIRYDKLKKAVKLCPVKNLSMEEQSVCDSCFKLLKQTTKVQIRKTSCVATPCTVGFLKPVVLLPEDFHLKEDGLQSILKHELAHIKHKDNLLLKILLVVTAIHWFNPVCYLYLKQIRNVNESYCDEAVTESMDFAQKKEYCGKLIWMAERKEDTKSEYFNLAFTGDSKTEIKRRIKNIMKKKTPNIAALLLAVLLLTVCGFCPAFAYEDIQEIDEGNAEYRPDAEEEFVPGDALVPAEELKGDDYFVDEDGNIYTSKASTDAKSACVHTYVFGTRKMHSKNGKGCRIDYFKAKRCTKCGYMKNLELYHTSTWKVCPH